MSFLTCGRHTYIERNQDFGLIEEAKRKSIIEVTNIVPKGTMLYLKQVLCKNG